MNKQLFSKRVKLALSILMVCVSLVSFVASPFLVQAFSAGAHGSINNTEIYTYNLDLSSLTYVTGYDLGGDSYQPLSFYGKNTVLPTYRVDQVLGVWVSLPITLVEGDYVDVDLGFRFSTGTFIQSWSAFNNGFTFSHSDTVWTSNEIGSSDYVYGTDSSGGSSYMQTLRAFHISSDGTNFFRFCYRLNPKSSTDVFFEFTSITITVYREKTWDDSQIKFEENQQEQITQSKNIFENLGDILSGLGQLPTKIGSALSGFFSSLKISVDGVSSTLWSYLSGPLSNILASISDNPEAVYNLFSGSLSDFLSKQDGILGGIGELPTKIGSALSGFFGSLETSVDGIGNDLWNYLAGPLSNILASISDNPEVIHNLFSGTLSEFMTKLDTEPDRIYSLFSGSLINMEDLMEKLLNPDSGIDHDFDQESSEAGEKLEQLAGDISVSKPSISDVETKVLTYTAASGIGQVAALFSIVTLNENVTGMLLAALSFGLMGLVFFGSKR